MDDSKCTAWKVIETLPDNWTKEQFLEAINIWNNNPRTVNQRVHSSIVVLRKKVASNIQLDKFLLKVWSLTKDVPEYNTQQFDELLRELGLIDVCDESNSSTEVYVKKLLPKSSKHFSTSFELVVIDHSHGWALFVGLPTREGVSLVPKLPYRLLYDSSIKLEVLDDQDVLDPSVVWLKTQLLPQVQKWASSSHTQAVSEKSNIGLPLKSHSLICAEKYHELYQTMKLKYGQQMVKMWPECTDPAKFVYEDIAIASYILLLWGEEKPVSFVDLGCGNGLLVHILNSEGHNGLGIDLRSRKIWDMYPEATKLQVRSITPSDNSLFPDADWVIGNHSDELTPWIPVIAARSSPKCKFFLLPCCPFDFDGFKYRRRNSHVSQYSDFLMYVKEVSEKCGFKTHIDRMRIPSTKRTCLVGMSRTYNPNDWDSVNSSINQLIEDGCRLREDLDEKHLPESSTGDNEWAADFKPREATERVRNCTQLEQGLISEIVSLTASHLLVKRRTVSHPTNPSKVWNAGGIAALGEIIPLIGAEKLKQLKSECGGLQTLLKNHHQVFKVEKGSVQLRTPILLSDVSNSKIKVKSKPCWFHHNHPDGCLLEESECAFKH